MQTRAAAVRLRNWQQHGRLWNSALQLLFSFAGSDGLCLCWLGTGVTKFVAFNRYRVDKALCDITSHWTNRERRIL
jgi:hypothetical protein